MEEKPYKTISVAVKNEDYEKWLRQLTLIFRFVRAKRCVPYLLLEKLFDLLGSIENLDKASYSEKVWAIAEKSDKYFSDKEDYVYNGNTDKMIVDFDPPPNEGEDLGMYGRRMDERIPEIVYERYSIRDMCLKVVSSYFNDKKYDLNKRVTKTIKRNGIRYLYKQIQLYSEQFTAEHKKSLSHYQKTVLATYFANQIGIVHPFIDETKNEKFWDRGKNDVKDYKPA